MQLENLPFSLPNKAEKLVISRDVQVDTDKLNNGIQLFKEWLQCNNYLPNDIDDVLIRNFLYGCKGNLETTKRKFESYIVNRTKLTQIFHNRVVTKKLLQPYDLTRIFYISPKLTPQGYRVFLMRLPSPDSTYFNCIDTYKYISLYFDLHLFNDENAGYEFIYDAKNLSMGIVAKLNLSLTQAMLQVIYNIMPFRLKGIHVVNTSPAMDIVMKMSMSVLSKKLKERIHHSKVEELSQHIAEECLPNQYGGTAGGIEVLCQSYHDFLMENSTWVKQIDKLQLTGPIPENRKDFYSFEEFSMDGTFRTLNID